MVPELRLPRARGHDVPAEAARAARDADGAAAAEPRLVGERGARATTSASGSIGHSSSIQPASRLQQDIRGSDGTLYRKGTAIPQRADFNTLDNPFFWSADPSATGWGPGRPPGVHFVVFNPTSDDFHRNRLAMDGHMPGRRRS